MGNGQTVSQSDVAMSLVPMVVFWGAAYFLYKEGYKKTGLTMGAFGLGAPILMAGGGLLYLKNKGYFDKKQPAPTPTALSSQDGYIGSMLAVI